MRVYEIEGAELNSDQTSGDTILWAKAKTEQSAKKKAEAMLKNKKVGSVWIHLYDSKLRESGEPMYQWVKYTGKQWRGGDYW